MMSSRVSCLCLDLLFLEHQHKWKHFGKSKYFSIIMKVILTSPAPAPKGHGNPKHLWSTL